MSDDMLRTLAGGLIGCSIFGLVFAFTIIIFTPRSTACGAPKSAPQEIEYASETNA